MTKEIKKILDKYDHLLIGKIGRNPNLDDVWTDDWIYQIGEKEITITYKMREESRDHKLIQKLFKELLHG